MKKKARMMDANFLQNNGFTFSIERLPGTSFALTGCVIPEISIEPATTSYTPGVQFFPGSASDFSSLSIEFIVDQNLNNYEELYRWITQQRYGEKFAPKNESENLLVSDASVVTLDAASNPNRVFQFKDLFPVSLGSLSFDTTVDQTTQITCSAQFRFSYFILK